MSQPEIVQSALGDETVVAQVDLGGEDELYVTPTRTLLYRAEGLLSDESVDEYPHGAERITVSEGRRKAKVTLDYGLDGEETIPLPVSRLERALPPIVEGVLRHNGVLDDDESVVQLFRFSELTVIVADDRVVRHIGSGLWDGEFESYHYSDVSDLEFEDGSVNTSVVLTVDGQRERFKTPNDDARAVRSALESSLLSYWEVDSVDELRAAAAPDDPDDDAGASEASDEVSFGDGPDPLLADPSEPEELPDNATRSPGDAGSESGTAAESGADRPASGGQASSDPGIDEIVGSGRVETDAGATSESSGAADASPDADASAAAASPEDATARGGAQGGDRQSGGASGAGGRRDRTGGSGGGFEGSGFEAAAPATDEQVLEELAALREVVEQQNKELAAQRDLIERLIEELRRGR